MPKHSKPEKGKMHPTPGLSLVPGPVPSNSKVHFPTHQKYEKSIVEVSVTYQRQYYNLPWSGSSFDSCFGTGFVIEHNGKNYIMTNAHVVEDNVHIKVRIANSEKKYTAKPIHICYQSDMALLEVADPEFNERVKPVKLGKMVKLQDEVMTIGFPKGGDEISVTKGIVSRIQMRTYAQSGLNMLQVQVDSAINNGNSGGPIFSNGKVVGIAFQGEWGDGLGYMIPIPMIEHFLKEVFSDQSYRGFPELPMTIQNLSSDSLRKYYHMHPDLTGVRLSKIDNLSDAYQKLKTDDILLEMDGYKISNTGKVDIPEIGNRIDYDFLCHMKYVGDTVKLKILRQFGAHKAKVLTIEVMLEHPPLVTKKIPPDEHDRSPTYFFASGILFQPLTGNYLDTSEGARLNRRFIAGMGSLRSVPKKVDMDEQFVIINDILDCEETQGFLGYSNVFVKEVNGKVIKNIHDVVQAIEGNKKAFHCITLDSNSKIVVKNMSKKEHDELLKRYNIKFDRSDDLQLNQLNTRLSNVRSIFQKVKEKDKGKIKDKDKAKDSEKNKEKPKPALTYFLRSKTEKLEESREKKEIKEAMETETLVSKKRKRSSEKLRRSKRHKL